MKNIFIFVIFKIEIMEKFKHTPGPWRIASQNYDKCFYVIHAKDETSTDGREVQVISMNYGSHPIKEHLDRMQANAKLIAAAPEMLDMLKRLHNGQSIYPEVHKEMGELIKKVTQ